MIVGAKSACTQQTEEFIKEPDSTIIHTNDEDVSVMVSSTNIPQSQTECSIKVQEINRGGHERIPMELPMQTDGSFKTYMDYRTITSVVSDQFKLQQQAYTDENGFRKIDDAYCIALGSAFGTEIGSKYRIILDTGIEFMGILSDCKDDADTDSSNRYIERNGNIIEFIVSVNHIEDMSKVMGDMSYSNLQGGIVSIERMIE